MKKIKLLIDFIRGGKTTYDEVKKLQLSESEKQIIESAKRDRDNTSRV